MDLSLSVLVQPFHCYWSSLQGVLSSTWVLPNVYNGKHTSGRCRSSNGMETAPALGGGELQPMNQMVHHPTGAVNARLDSGLREVEEADIMKILMIVKNWLRVKMFSSDQVLA